MENARTEIAALKSQLAERDGQMAQMREALKFYASTWKNYCGDHGVPIGLEPNERLLNDQGERARRTLTSTTDATTYRDQIRREALEEAAKVAEAYPSGAVSRNSTGDKIATAIRSLAGGE